MNITTDQLLMIIGSKEAEIVMLRMKIAELEQKVRDYESAKEVPSE